jgi:hypothetical protein
MENETLSNYVETIYSQLRSPGTSVVFLIANKHLSRFIFEGVAETSGINIRNAANMVVSLLAVVHLRCECY